VPCNISQILGENDSVITSEDDEDAEMSHGEILYESDESDVDCMEISIHCKMGIDSCVWPRI
jgi:hypothetical protein